ncbi:MAG: hypothetical protein Q4G34_06990 [Micrococcus sp.]|nr:hypothetical protein [Micrococcus sp.]
MIVASSALLLSACGTDQVQPDTSARAQLDRDTVQVVLPLDQYEVSDADEQLVNNAVQTSLRACLNARGVNGLAPSAHSAPSEDRPYGLWNIERAAQFGYGFPEPEATAEPPLGGEWSSSTDEAFNEAYTACDGELASSLDAMSPPSSDASTVRRLRETAYTHAYQDQRWKDARAEWQACLTQHGLQARDDDSAWSSQQGLDVLTMIDPVAPDPGMKHEEIRVATIEATCNEQTQLTQRLGDIEAGYQAALIKGQEATLAEEKQQNQAYVDAARAYLASHQ